MPRGDKTGPEGMGPMTGRGAGYCAGFQVPGFANPVGGRGYWGRGRGGGGGRARGGFGWRNQYYATGLPGWARVGVSFPGSATPTVTAEQEMTGLKQQAEFLQNNLSQINERIEQLEELESSGKKKGK